MILPRRKILFLQTNMHPRGGATAVAAWILETLKDEYDVTLLTAEPVDWHTVNFFFGTSIGQRDVSIIVLNATLRALFRLDPDAESILPLAYMMRICRRIRHRYDLVICAAMEEADLGGNGLLYVHYPTLNEFWTCHRDFGKRPLPGLISLLRGKIRPWVLLSGYSLERMKQCRMLSNSDWTGALIRKRYGVPTTTIYPPVTPASGALPWKARENGFATIGRFNRHKRLDWIIELLSRLRAHHSDLRLHIIGTRDEGREEAEYYRSLVRLAEANTSWLTLHESLSREELLRLLGRVRYAIHAKQEEHFGIAPAEALVAGCIPFVHNSGGQIEIVGSDSRLCFSDDRDAIGKIDRVLIDNDLQKSLRIYLRKQAELFTTERFKTEFGRVVQSALETTSRGDKRPDRDPNRLTT